MKKVLVASLLALSLPATAVAKEPTKAHKREYKSLYHEAVAKFGKRTPGCNLFSSCHHKATDAKVEVSIAVLRRMVTPVSVPQAPVASQTSVSASTPTSTPTAAPVASQASVGGSPLPACTWQPESGGNPHAVNPSSGAGGYYQIMPSTWAAYGGTGAPQDAPMSEQTAIAQKVMASQGPSAWVNC